MPQGSVLGPLLFNIYFNDLFFVLSCEACNFADDTTPFVSDLNLEIVLEKLEENAKICNDWFDNNYMKMNPDKSHLLVSGNKSEHMWAKVGEDTIWETNEVKLLGVNIDNNLKFDKHTEYICQKANAKLTALSRMCKFLNLNQRRVLFKAFFESQFKYCPLVWMFHSRRSNNKINKLHERALRLVYNDHVSSFECLLERDGSFSVHDSNIQSIAIEMFKVFKNLHSGNEHELFSRNDNEHFLRSQSDFLIPQVNTVLKGQCSIRYLGPIIWNLIPSDIKKADSLSVFKSEIRKWKPRDCPCRLCKDFVPGLGFTDSFE